ncbi:hypothetical protein LXL04_015340 [Taraxacum kok-saghyz]
MVNGQRSVNGRSTVIVKLRTPLTFRSGSATAPDCLLLHYIITNVGLEGVLLISLGDVKAQIQWRCPLCFLHGVLENISTSQESTAARNRLYFPKFIHGVLENISTSRESMMARNRLSFHLPFPPPQKSPRKNPQEVSNTRPQPEENLVHHYQGNYRLWLWTDEGEVHVQIRAMVEELKEDIEK